jgi:GNAT superfamily N-acetyltransferase
VGSDQPFEDGCELEVSANPSQRDIRILSEGIERFNQSTPFGADRTKVPLAVWLRRDGGLFGGAYGDTHYGWLYLSSLWVDQALRGRGWGSRLMERFESEGCSRGCRRAWVDTYGFQAPHFYGRLGYREFGRLDDFPPGSTRHFYWKPLRP